MDKREQAQKLWEESKGELPLKEIARQLDVKEGTLRSWKKRDSWGCNVATLRNDATQRERQRKRKAQVNRKLSEAVSDNKKLTEREKDFCVAMCHAPNASQAAMMTDRYSTYGAARTAAYKMLEKPAVKAEIDRLRSAKRAAMLADADDVIDLHMRIAFADMTAFAEFGRTTVPVMGPFGPIQVKDPKTGNTFELKREINEVRFKEHDLVDGTVITEVKQGKDGASVKLADRQKSLAFLERFFELNPMDRHKKEYDKKRLQLAERETKLHEDKLHGISTDIDAIKEGLKGLIDIINSPVPDRRLDDE